jgi:outer membrane lipoprotein-sorting protein
MKNTRLLSVLALLALMAVGATVSAQEDAAEIMKKSHLAYYYAADDGLADVTMTLVDKKGKERNREFTMLRLDIEEGGRQEYYTYFKKPSDVSRMTFMVHKTPDGNDARKIYVPAVDLIKPISADDKNSSFVGSDFSYEDVSGRHWTEDAHSLTGEQEFDGRTVWVIESVPNDGKGFARKVSYIDQENLLPLQEEYYDDKGNMVRRFTAVEIAEIDGVTTMTVRKMEDLKKGSHTIVDFSSIKYNVGITEELFSDRYLKNPPRKFVK